MAISIWFTPHPSRWEVKQKDTALIIGVDAALLRSVTGERGLDFQQIEILNRFQTRDPQIEHIGGLSKPSWKRAPPDGSIPTASPPRWPSVWSNATARLHALKKDNKPVGAQTAAGGCLH